MPRYSACFRANRPQCVVLEVARVSREKDRINKQKEQAEADL
ncbi:hypothetical protein RAB80_007358 [Fusarium oxysporum f. sp. vasinfectum]|nr:hypothetical protein RAB80_007358 [Fusarium oxysporum f. sp. vasinfectum]